MTFDAFIAIDWSGAGGRYGGIAVARCKPGSCGPRLVVPAGGRWTRTAIAAWLTREIATGQRLLVGFDFAFGFPFEPACGYLGGHATGVDGIFDLWSLIDAASGTDDDFGCAPFVADTNYAPLFWTRGPKPPAWVERRRQAERSCGALTGTYPESLYKLVGPKQVGKASLTGMRVLHHVRQATNGAVAIWPFESGHGTVFVEIYPTLFRKEATGSVAKIKSAAVLNDALRVFGSRAALVPPGPLPDHATDALISVAGLRARLCGDDPLRAPPSVEREGWIFGVRPT